MVKRKKKTEAHINVDGHYNTLLCMMQNIIRGVKRDEAIAVTPKMEPQSATHTCAYNGSITTACHEIAMAAALYLSLFALSRARRANKLVVAARMSL